MLFNDYLKNEFPELAQKFDSLVSRMQYFQIEFDFWCEIQKEYVTDRHWSEIFKLLKKDFTFNKEIVIKDIMELPVKLYSLEIREILTQAKNEHRYSKLLQRIKYNVNNIKLKVIKYKEYHILSEFDLASEQIEEDLISIEASLHNIESIPFKDELTEWKQKLSLMQNTIEKLMETQKVWLGLEATFKNSSLKA